MKIIEQFNIGKRKGTPCEDGYIVTSDYAAVVDGSTAKIKVAAGQESPGHLAMRLTCEAIGLLPPEASKSEALALLTRALAQNTTYRQAHYRPTCSAVIYSRHRQEIWFVGDCQARWNAQTHQYEKDIDRLLTGIRCDVVHYYLANGYTEEDIRQEDKGRAFIFDALCEQLHFQNDPNPYNPFRYPVIDGQPIDPEEVPVLSVTGIKELILASDGYPQLRDTLQETEDALQQLLLQDPLCINEHPASKCLVEGNRSFDDRTYLRIALDENE